MIAQRSLRLRGADGSRTARDCRIARTSQPPRALLLYSLCDAKDGKAVCDHAFGRQRPTQEGNADHADPQPRRRMHDEVTGWRRHLHTMPELLYDVHQTAAFVGRAAARVRLRRGGAPGIGRTGVVGIIRGKAAPARRSACAPTWTRCRSTEITGKPYASTTPGKMHACGHDGHTAMLLGAAKYLAETRNFAGSRRRHLPAGRRGRRRRRWRWSRTA